MKATGIVRRIDDLGRVVIPKEIRRTLRIREGDPLEIFTDRNGEIILKKYSPIGELGAFAKDGIDYLLKNTDAEFVFPMHMWQDYSPIKEYKKSISNLGMADRVMEIARENQVFLFGEN